jgi:predicted transposase/invertase (TIGR01784 family)
MNPKQRSQLLRQYLHEKSTSDAAKSVSSPGAYVVRDPAVGNGPPIRDERATSFLNGIVARFEDMKGELSRPRHDGKMDFACLLSTEEFALVQIQVISEDLWDRRALAYVSDFYGNQVSMGHKWKDLRKVISVNILGGAWPDAPDQFMRHYKFEDQLNGKGRFIDGIELFQYSIMNAPTVDGQGIKDWVTFFRRAHLMNEEEVAAEIKTPAVLRAFELAKISKLPAEVRASYEAEDDDFDRYSQHTAEEISKATHNAKMDGQVAGKREGKLEGKLEAAQMMLKAGRPLNEIQEYTGLSSAEIEGIKSIGS